MARKVGSKKARAKNDETVVINNTESVEIPVEEVKNEPVIEEETIEDVVNELNDVASNIDERLTNIDNQDNLQAIVKEELNNLDKIEKKIEVVEKRAEEPKKEVKKPVNNKRNNSAAIARFWNGMTSGWYE